MLGGELYHHKVFIETVVRLTEWEGVCEGFCRKVCSLFKGIRNDDDGKPYRNVLRNLSFQTELVMIEMCALCRG